MRHERAEAAAGPVRDVPPPVGPARRAAAGHGDADARPAGARPAHRRPALDRGLAQHEPQHGEILDPGTGIAARRAAGYALRHRTRQRPQHKRRMRCPRLFVSTRPAVPKSSSSTRCRSASRVQARRACATPRSASTSWTPTSARVAYTGLPGSYCEVRVVPADRLVKIPDGITDEQAASMMLKGLTVHYLIHTTYAVQRGDTVLWHAAAGGVGVIACQWLKTLGVTVIGTVGSEEKAQ